MNPHIHLKNESVKNEKEICIIKENQTIFLLAFQKRSNKLSSRGSWDSVGASSSDFKNPLSNLNIRFSNRLCPFTFKICFAVTLLFHLNGILIN